MLGLPLEHYFYLIFKKFSLIDFDFKSIIPCDVSLKFFVRFDFLFNNEEEEKKEEIKNEEENPQSKKKSKEEKKA